MRDMKDLAFEIDAATHQCKVHLRLSSQVRQRMTKMILKRDLATCMSLRAAYLHRFKEAVLSNIKSGETIRIFPFLMVVKPSNQATCVETDDLASRAKVEQALTDASDGVRAQLCAENKGLCPF